MSSRPTSWSHWPEDRDEPESDGKEAGDLVESTLDNAGLDLVRPSKAAVGDEWLKEETKLRAVDGIRSISTARLAVGTKPT